MPSNEQIRIALIVLIISVALFHIFFYRPLQNKYEKCIRKTHKSSECDRSRELLKRKLIQQTAELEQTLGTQLLTGFISEIEKAQLQEQIQNLKDKVKLLSSSASNSQESKADKIKGILRNVLEEHYKKLKSRISNLEVAFDQPDVQLVFAGKATITQIADVLSVLSPLWKSLNELEPEMQSKLNSYYKGLSEMNSRETPEQIQREMEKSMQENFSEKVSEINRLYQEGNILNQKYEFIKNEYETQQTTQQTNQQSNQNRVLQSTLKPNSNNSSYSPSTEYSSMTDAYETETERTIHDIPVIESNVSTALIDSAPIKKTKVSRNINRIPSATYYD